MPPKCQVEILTFRINVLYQDRLDQNRVGLDYILSTGVD